MNFDLNLGKAASVLFLALAMAGCGGGGGTTQAPVEPEPMMHPVDLAGVTAGAMAGAMAGELSVAAGDSGDHGNITFSCPPGGDDCMIEVMVADDGTVSATSTGGMATAMDSNAYVLGNTRERVRLYRVTSERRAAAVDAAKMAAMAVKDAVKYGAMFTATDESAAEDARANDIKARVTASAKGDSMMAMENAQTVLDARDETKQAVMDAEQAKTDLEMAQTEAMALPDDAERASLLTAIGNAITAVEEQVEMAEESRDSDGLKNALNAVEYGLTTFEPTPTSKAREASYYGDLVAEAIDEIVNPILTTGTQYPTGAVPTGTALVEATDVVNMTDNRMGMTFDMIVGEDKLMNMRIDRTGDSAQDSGTKEVMAASFAGMKLIDITEAAANQNLARPTVPSPTADVEVADGNQYSGNYMGIAGTVFCAGDDCKVVTEVADDPATTGADENEALNASTLVGSWYFAPDDAKETYTKAEDATDYSLEMDFVDFGYWFRVTTSDGTIALNVLSAIPTGRASAGSPAIAASPDPETGKPEGSAEYEGDAVGLSVYKPDDDNDGDRDFIRSGSFTATVNLKAYFGSTNPNISGTVSDFDGNAVNKAWTVQLDEVAISDAVADPTSPAVGTTNSDVSGASPGSWQATAMAPPASVRPGSSARSTPTSRTAISPGRTPPARRKTSDNLTGVA